MDSSAAVTTWATGTLSTSASIVMFSPLIEVTGVDLSRAKLAWLMSYPARSARAARSLRDQPFRSWAGAISRPSECMSFMATNLRCDAKGSNRPRTPAVAWKWTPKR